MDNRIYVIVLVFLLLGGVGLSLSGLLDSPEQTEEVIEERNVVSINQGEVVDINRAEVVDEPEPKPEPVVGKINEDCPYGKEFRSTPENPMTYTCQLITLEGEVELSMRNKRFEQTEIQVKKGTTVTWINKDNSDPEYMPIHTVAIDLLNVKSPDLEVSGGARAVWSYTFNEIGEFEYYCSIHPVMTGKIIVVE